MKSNVRILVLLLALVAVFAYMMISNRKAQDAQAPTTETVPQSVPANGLVESSPATPVISGSEMPGQPGIPTAPAMPDTGAAIPAGSVNTGPSDTTLSPTEPLPVAPAAPAPEASAPVNVAPTAPVAAPAAPGATQ